ncbi:amino acid adenylation domain-containing protein [Streptomyces buecherae]|uniref:amino acid adenylation domain-containing protein n=1 Tax=Streptomyces buecherae TaxID=2763006 RepID=UPI0036844109
MNTFAGYHLPLSAAQREIWIAHHIDVTGALHNCGGYVEINGEVDEGKLAEAVRLAAAETEAPRLRFATEDGEPHQYLAESADPLRVVRLDGERDPERAAEEWMHADLARPTDLADGPLVHHTLLRLTADRSLFFLRYHHIVLDGYGQVLYWRRLGALYTAQVTGVAARPTSWAPLADLLAEERAYRASDQHAADRAHWLATMAERPEPLRLGDASTPPAVPAPRHGPPARVEHVRQSAARHQAHWSAVVIAATAGYLHRVSGQSDLVIGLPVRARTSRAALTTPGMFANVLPLRLAVTPETTCGQLVEQVASRVSELLSHQRYRGEELHRELRAQQGAADPSGVVVNVIPFDGAIRFGTRDGAVHQVSSGPVRDVAVEFFGGTDGSDVRVRVDAAPRTHEANTLDAHRAGLSTFLAAFTTAPTDHPVGRVDLLDPAGRDRLAAEDRAHARAYDLDRCLHELVLDQAARTPDAVAVRYADTALSFRELLDQAARIAAHLRSLGVGPGHLVGVHDERSPRLVTELLAVLLAGAGYLPLDPELPAARLAFQIEDAAPTAVLTRSDLAAQLAETGARLIATDTLLPTLPDAAPPTAGASPDDTAYVIYTSGSTGRPKGVAVPHRGVVNRLLWMRETYQLTAEDQVLQKTPTTFDVSVWEFFWPLLAGATLRLAAPGAHRDPRALAETIRAYGVTTTHFVPSMLDLFLAEPAAAELPSLRRVLCSGEALRPETVGRFFARYAPGEADPAIELHNLYGPTEASIDVTHWRCRPGDAAGPVPIGHAVANTSLYVLDAAGQPVPDGLPGELHIGGVQVATGYLRRPELTAAAFRPNPYGAGTLYRTGDRVVRRADGALLYGGRLDHQIKINGFRVEPGEVESVLLGHPALAQAVVSAPHRPDGQPHLVAHVVPRSDGQAPAPESGALLSWLRERLPSQLVPAHLLVIDALPLLPNGKLDRSALPAPGAQPDQAPATPPDTAAERLLHAAWATVLGVADFGVDDSFFTLGGDSMHALRVRAETERGGHTFAVAELFAGPSVRELARVLRPVADAAPRTEPFGLLTPADRELLPAGLDDAYPLSAMQAGMLYHAAYATDSAVYRVVTSVRVAARLDLDALRAALADVARRHPSLRCSFDLTRYSEPLQLVHHQVTVPLERGDDLGGLSEDERRAAIHAWVARAKFTRFDPAEPPLLRFTAHPCGPDQFELSVVEHHVVLDGWSDMRMLEEIVEHYAAHLAGAPLDLPAVAATYRDFVAAERAATADPAARDYWSRVLTGAGDGPLAAMAGSAPGPHEAGGSRRYDVPVPPETAARLRAHAQGAGLPLKSLLTAAHLAVLRLVGGRDEVLTGVVANARLEAPGGDETIGVFLNTLPFRADLAQATVLDAARAAFAHERDSAAHRRYPYARMRDDQGREPRLDAYVNFMDFHRDRRRGQGLPMTVTVGVAETNYPLAANFLVDPDGGGLQLWLDCDPAALPPEFCARLAGYYARALEHAAHHPSAPVHTLDLLDAAEHRRLAAWHGPVAEYDRGATVHGLIERRAAERPRAVALAHRHEELDYAGLDTRANQLAHHLAALGVGRGDLVGVSLRRGPDLVVALLAVLKAGAAYVPMDPGFPRGRLATIATDADLSCLVQGPGTPEGLTAPRLVDVRADAAAIAARPGQPLERAIGGEDTAYVIYTSGSTGAPKGTAVRHRNAVNYFTGMDQRVGCGPDDVVLAVTSVSFDISVTELLWPLTHGARVVLAGERVVSNLVPQVATRERAATFSLFFFAASGGDDNRAGYQLVLDAARFADRNGFEAVWTPERHFNAFGGLYPNPSVMSAALSTITDRIALRSGSVVAPLHDAVRMAEEWSLVDNLSGGRVGLAFAAGWNSNDFVLRPENFADRKRVMADHLADFRTLWRGEPLRRVGGSGEEVDVRIFPAPVQDEPPIWLTSVGTLETFRKAGATGANLLTHLLGQTPAELAERLAAYREARAAAGHQSPGQVTVMVHTFLSDDPEQAREQARGPFRDYLLSSTELWRTVFATTGHDLPEMGAREQLEAVVDLAIDRYFATSGLFGSPETCADLVRGLSAAGVDEIACLIDFGVEPAAVMDSLGWVNKLRDAHELEVADSGHSLAELCARHRVTLAQGTPSLLSAIAAEPEALEALNHLRALLVGGEAFPPGLAERLHEALPKVAVFNMYGPTETTIWSTAHALDPDGEPGTTVPIGTPLANTRVRVADAYGHPVPVGVSGELWIGGDGVAAGYLGRPELTAERFVTADDGHGYYRTGDRVRRRADGVLEFLGRIDRQVKILGHRVEPDEVESVLSRHPELSAVAVTAVDGPRGTELVAYVAPASTPSDDAAREAHVRGWSEVWESAYTAQHPTDPTDPAEAAEADGADHATGSPFAGWLSSYTGEPIPEPQMREWLAHTVERVRELGPGAVADIGVGVGLVLRSLAERADAYHGVDISPAALSAAARCLGPDHPLPAHVTLAHAGPEYLATLAPGSLDTVVLNSVVQYFPGTGYLRTVLTDALRALRPGGAVFVGDVRSVEMLPEFHTAVQLHRATPVHTVAEIRAAVDRQAREERELCLSPAFFRQFAAEAPGDVRVRVELKRGRADNELSLFRYDVTLFAPPATAGPDDAPRPGEPATTPAPRVVAYTDPNAPAPAGATATETLRGHLARAGGPVLVTGIPNRRLVGTAAAVRVLADAADAGEATTAWDVERALWELTADTADADAGAHPEDVWELAARTGHTVRLLVPEDGRLDRFDALFHPADPTTADPAPQDTAPAGAPPGVPAPTGDQPPADHRPATADPAALADPADPKDPS